MTKSAGSVIFASMVMTRSTRQREAIKSAIKAVDRPLTPAEILEHAKKDVKTLNLGTVYRNLKALVEAEEVVVVELLNEPSRYEIAGKGHHHHFRCQKCEHVYDVHGCHFSFSKLVPKGFKLEGHEMILFGTCSNCR